MVGVGVESGAGEATAGETAARAAREEVEVDAEFVVMVPISGDAHRSTASLDPTPDGGRRYPRCASHWVDRGRSTETGYIG